jgi:hypothetical protein
MNSLEGRVSARCDLLDPRATAAGGCLLMTVAYPDDSLIEYGAGTAF